MATAIDGALTFSTLGPYLRDLPSAAGETLDLARCSRIDSAGAAYLLERTRRARARGLTLRIIKIRWYCNHGTNDVIIHRIFR